MSNLNATPGAERVHIGIFGRRNAGKSSLINALTGQSLAVVSDVRGTTTDPVSKAMEILPLGPVLITDTPGLDDEGTLGSERVKKAVGVMNKTDIAIIVADAQMGVTDFEEDIKQKLIKKNIPYIAVLNKSDTMGDDKDVPDGYFAVSAKTGEGINQLREMLAHKVPSDDTNKKIVGDLLKPSDVVVLVVPVDLAAPKGRLILPQQQTIRDILDADCMSIVTKETQLEDTLKSLSVKPRMVITDSQAFEFVSKVVPRDIPLTSFSILFARYKGELTPYADGAKALHSLQDGDTVLISEGCTHHRQCDDIGTVKMPRWIEKFTGKTLRFETSSGTGFPEDLTKYKLIVHCGGCMLNAREMKNRMAMAKEQGVPMVNYGIAIAYMNGILERSTEVFIDEVK